MNPDQRANVKRAVLTTLNECGGYMLPEAALVAQVPMMVTPPPTVSEVRDILGELERGRLVAGVTPALGGDKKWTISDAGKAALMA